MDAADRADIGRILGSLEAARVAVTNFFSDDEGATRGRDRLVMARALGSLFFAGAVVGLITLVLPHWRGANVAGIAAVCAIALAVGVGMTIENGRLPTWTF